MRRRWNPNGMVAAVAARMPSHRAAYKAIREVLDGPEGEVIRARVDRGADWLARRDPEWREKIKAAVGAKGFDLRSGQRCAVGSVLGSYWAFSPGSFEACVARGFTLPRSFGDDEEFAWACIEQAWVDKVYEVTSSRGSASEASAA